MDIYCVCLVYRQHRKYFITTSYYRYDSKYFISFLKHINYSTYQFLDIHFLGPFMSQLPNAIDILLRENKAGGFYDNT